MGSPLHNSYVLDKSLLAFYPFDEGAETIYSDLSENQHHILVNMGDAAPVRGSSSHNPLARRAAERLDTNVRPTKIVNKTFEFEVKFVGNPLSDVTVLSTPNTEENALSVSLVISASTKVVGFGYGESGWDIYDTDPLSAGPNRNIVWSTVPLQDEIYNHVVVSVDSLGYASIYVNGAPGGVGPSVELIDIDAGDVANSTISAPIGLLSHAPSDESNYFSFNNLAIYSEKFSEEDVQNHYNVLSYMDTLYEGYLVEDLIPVVTGELGPIREIELVGEATQRLEVLRIEATASLTVKFSAADDFDNRGFLEDEGFMPLDLSGATTEPGEPGSGFLGTEWYEIPFTAEDSEKAYVEVSAPNSVVQVRVFKAPFLDELGADSDEILIDDDVPVHFSQLVPVTSASSDSIFLLDEDYGSNYFAQIILVSGDGLDVEFSWGSADPFPGGLFEDPIDLNTSVVGRSEDGTTSNAYLEPGEPVSAEVAGEVALTRSVWYSWVSPDVVDIPVNWSVNVSGEGGSTVEIFKVPSVEDPTFADLVPVTANYSSIGGTIPVQFTPEAATTYRIKVGSEDSDSTVSLLWSPPIEEVPASDPFAQLRVTVHAGAAGGEYFGQTYAPNAFITELPNRTGAQFQEALNTAGTGTITVLQNDPVMRSFSPPGWVIGGDPNNPTLSGTYQLGSTVGSIASTSTIINVSTALPTNVVAGVVLQIGATNSSTTKYIKVKKRNSSTSITITHRVGATFPAGTPIYTTLQPEDDPFRLLRVGNFVKFWVQDDGVDKCVSGFVIKNREIPVVSSGEDTDRTITVSGPTFLHLLNDIVVMHDNPGLAYKSEDRNFSWNSSVTSKDLWANGGWFDNRGDYSVNKHSWNNPIKANSIKNPPGWRKKRNEKARKRPKYALALLPKKKRFPAPTAKWMWISRYEANRLPPKFPRGHAKTHYYRAKKVAIKKAGSYLLSVCSDTSYGVYLDGELKMSGNGLERYTKIDKKIINLSPTTEDTPNSICIYVGDQNDAYKATKKKKKKKSGKKGKKKYKKTKVDLDHNDAILFSLHALDKARKPKGAAILTSSGTEKWYAHHGGSTPPPTWSRAQVLMTLLREGAERNNDSAKLIYNQTKAVAPHLGYYSSDGEGFGYNSEWWDLKKYSASIKVGTSLLDVQAQMSETLKFDVWIDPDTLRLHAYQGGKNGAYPRGTDKSANVALVPGQNLIDYMVTENDQMVNTLLVQYSEGEGSGFVVVEPDVNSPQGDLAAYYGTREAYFEYGSHGAAAAEDLAEALLTSLIDTTKLSNAQDIVGHINEQYAGSIIPVKGSVPFLDFNVGDTISAPGYNGIMHPHRVLSLSCTEDSEGNLVFEPELEGS